MTKLRDKGEIHLGDLARALETLNWEDDRQARAIASCLGFELKRPPKPRPPVEICDRQAYPDRPGTRPEAAARLARPRFAPPAPEPLPPLPATQLPSRILGLPERTPAAPDNNDWLDDEDALYQARDEPPLARRPLFLERTSRHIVSAALATLRRGSEIDHARLTDALCRRQALAELPMLPEATLELGCQLLLDYSASMVPFWEDLNGLIGQVGEVAGPANVRVYSFDTRPTEALRWTPQGERESWRPEGRPVLAATDFGIQGLGGRARPDPAWRAFAEDCAGAGVPLLILVPWPKDRWPPDLGGRPELVHWNPHTSAAMVRKRVGLGHRIG